MKFAVVALLVVVALAPAGCGDGSLDVTGSTDGGLIGTLTKPKDIARAFGTCNRITSRTETNPNPPGFEKCLVDHGVPASRVDRLADPQFRGDGDGDPDS